MASAGEIMTTNIIAARPDMLVRDVAKLLLITPSVRCR